MLDYPLIVKRKLVSGAVQTVGELAEDKSGTYFQYDDKYLSDHNASLSPFKLNANNLLQKAPAHIHYGLHGVFADSLPDGWGLYLMDRVLRNNGYNPRAVTALERLAFIGDSCLGALFYEPALDYEGKDNQENIDIINLGREAVNEFEGTESHLIEHLMTAGGSGGARPKLNITKLADGRYTTNGNVAGEKLLVKLTSNQFYLKHAESLVEYVYMTMAKDVGIEVADFDLFDAGGGHFWLQQSRFDCVAAHGRYHMISACGLLDAPFREPSLDYVELIRATQKMCGTVEARKLLQRAIFNYLTVNQDDHSKNFAFLADDQNNWRLSPFYDIVYSPSPYGEHMTAFNCDGRRPSKKSMEVMGGHVGLSGAKAVMDIAEQIYVVVKEFSLKPTFRTSNRNIN
ncbi:MAG: type II toxin-antitoxin system HipA family toxin [Psychrosphaera sp.]|nr:type II toxin-antitoxin system HipA family toxin [Psychrosphaera sp.]